MPNPRRDAQGPASSPLRAAPAGRAAAGVRCKTERRGFLKIKLNRKAKRCTTYNSVRAGASVSKQQVPPQALGQLTGLSYAEGPGSDVGNRWPPFSLVSVRVRAPSPGQSRRLPVPSPPPPPRARGAGFRFLSRARLAFPSQTGALRPMVDVTVRDPTRRWFYLYIFFQIFNCIKMFILHNI